MSGGPPSTRAIHAAFLAAFNGRCSAESSINEKPLLVKMDLPLPSSVRVYAYSLVGGIGTRRDFEYKASLRLQNHPVGEYGFFDYSGGRVTLLLAHQSELRVWVLWDASLHQRVKNGGNIQVQTGTVMAALAGGIATQRRRLQGGVWETVIACTTPYLADAVIRRADATGGSDAALTG